MQERPALRLEGLELEGGWKVVKLRKPLATDTGGYFSVQYTVINKDGKEAFLKALDFSKALQSKDKMAALQAMTEAYIFERELLKKCKSNKLSKVITPLADGNVEIPGEVGELRFVFYLIFELADGNMRQLKKFDAALAIRSLHNMAVAMQQLHSHGIAHQDLKPSNVLVLDKQKEFKVADLGRASDREVPFEHDDFLVAGDPAYAPLELIYGYSPTNEFYKRYGVDMYLFGSLIFSYFSGISATQAIKVKLSGQLDQKLTRNNFLNDLAYIQEAFFNAVKSLDECIRPMCGDLTNELILIVQQLCEPDPSKRGHPLNRRDNQYSFERYISRLAYLTSKAEYSLKYECK